MTNQTSKYHLIGSNISQNRQTYLVENKKGKKFVVKRFLFNHNSLWQGYDQLEREVAVLKKLEHPQIPKFFKFFEDKSACYLVQEYIKADNLEEQNVSQKEVWLIAKQILEILTCLESKQIVHKDIKPSNILWDGKTAYLIDFGFASSSSLTPGASSLILGTPGFFPPEQFTQGIISTQGDLYSLGITLFCKLAKIKSTQIVSYLNQDHQLDLNKIQQIDLTDKLWLKKIIAPNLLVRYKTPQMALDELLLKSTKASQPQTLLVNSLNPDYNQIQLQQINKIKQKAEDEINRLKLMREEPILYLDSCFKKTRNEIVSLIIRELDYLYSDTLEYSNVVFKYEIEVGVSDILNEEYREKYQEKAFKILEIIEKLIVSSETNQIKNEIKKYADFNFCQLKGFKGFLVGLFTNNDLVSEPIFDFDITKSEAICLPSLKDLFTWFEDKQFAPLLNICKQDYSKDLSITINFTLRKGIIYRWD